MLTLIFIFIELARLFFAYMAVENGARYGVRYAITRDWDRTYCADPCANETLKEKARLKGIKLASLAGSTGIQRDHTYLDNFINSDTSPTDEERLESGFYYVTTCHRESGSTPWGELGDGPYCSPENAGDSGDMVLVVVDFNHPLIVPIISDWWPQVHLRARRESRVEAYRTLAVVNTSFGELLPELPPPPTAQGAPACDDPMFNKPDSPDDGVGLTGLIMESGDYNHLVTDMFNWTSHTVHWIGLTLEWDPSSHLGVNVDNFNFLEGNPHYGNPFLWVNNNQPSVTANWDGSVPLTTLGPAPSAREFSRNAWEIVFAGNLISNDMQISSLDVTLKGTYLIETEFGLTGPCTASISQVDLYFRKTPIPDDSPHPTRTPGGPLPTNTPPPPIGTPGGTPGGTPNPTAIAPGE
jgi:hypothetical protein